MTETVTRAGALEAAALDELPEGFRGEVIEPGSAQYEQTRAVFNGMFDRKPATILRPAGTADVIRAIGLARMSGLPLAIRGGGHSVAGFSMSDGGIVIDTRGMKGIRVDPKKRTARAQAGVNWGEFDQETRGFAQQVGQAGRSHASGCLVLDKQCRRAGAHGIRSATGMLSMKLAS